MKSYTYLALVAGLVLGGCVAEDGGEFYDAGVGGEGGFGGGGDPGDDLCAQGCLQLEACDRCIDQAGQCLSSFECAEQCRDTGDHATALCLADLNACDANSLDACLDGSGVDTCVAACGRLAACDTCLTDDAGTCVDDLDCLTTCREGGEGFECLAALDACDDNAIEACLNDDGAGDDDCADACRVLDGCGQCLIGEDDGECISVAACAEECRADWADQGACLNGLDMCDDEAIVMCLDGRANADACLQGCLFLDDCGYCALDEAGECLSTDVCAENCRANDPTENACLRELDSCDDEAALLACLDDDEPEPMGADECTRACAALDGCGLCWPDDDGECMELTACAESCRMGDPGEATAACLSRLDSCDEAPLDACFESPASVCETTCATRQGCGQIEAGDEAMMACVSLCEADPQSELLRCQRDAASCDAIAACDEPAPEPCDAACARWATCNPEQPDAAATCAEACPEWTDAQRACVTDTAECAEVLACLPVEPEPCQAACDRLVACQDVDDVDAALASCQMACPEWIDTATACIADAAECPDVLACELEAAEAPSCQAVCERREGCFEAEDPAAWIAECVMGCEETSAEARACVIEAADCAAVDACAAE